MIDKTHNYFQNLPVQEWREQNFFPIFKRQNDAEDVNENIYIENHQVCQLRDYEHQLSDGKENIGYDASCCEHKDLSDE